MTLPRGAVSNLRVLDLFRSAPGGARWVTNSVSRGIVYTRLFYLCCVLAGSAGSAGAADVDLLARACSHQVRGVEGRKYWADTIAEKGVRAPPEPAHHSRALLGTAAPMADVPTALA